MPPLALTAFLSQVLPPAQRPIHAMAPSMPPIMAAFDRLFPEATLTNLLDDSLATDLARAAQFSLSLAAASGETVLTTPHNAVRTLHRLLLPAKAG
jgi:hypothetical protein